MRNRKKSSFFEIENGTSVGHRCDLVVDHRFMAFIIQIGMDKRQMKINNVQSLTCVLYVLPIMNKKTHNSWRPTKFILFFFFIFSVLEIDEITWHYTYAIIIFISNPYARWSHSNGGFICLFLSSVHRSPVFDDVFCLIVIYAFIPQFFQRRSSFFF